MSIEPMRAYTLTGLISLLLLEMAVILPPLSLQSFTQHNQEIHASTEPRPTPAPYRGSGRRTTAILTDSRFH